VRSELLWDRLLLLTLGLLAFIGAVAVADGAITRTRGLGHAGAKPGPYALRLGLLARLDVLLLSTGFLLYLCTRLIGLSDFPIYFFCDEAIQATLAASLLERGFRDHTGTFLPPYFLNAEKWNLSLSVYIHTLTVAALGKSVFLTRATSVAVSLLAVVAISLALKQVFRCRFWWAAGLVLAAVPSWFLHSRTAFETVMMVSFYACFICAMLFYRFVSPRYLFLAVLFGAATFYSYANGQGLMLVSGILLLLTDVRHHLRQPRDVLLGSLALGILLAVPYLRFRSLHPEAFEGQLYALHSYWVHRIPVEEKLLTFGRNYLEGLNPSYWFLPNIVDLERHRIKGMGHLPIGLAPFLAVGLGVCLWRWRCSAYRTVLVGLLAAPFSAAVVAPGITRLLVTVVPATFLVCIGLGQVAGWHRPRVAYPMLAVASAAVLALSSLSLLRTALHDGPTWYSDYGLGGMQYGAQQVFAAIPEELAKSQETRILLSPTWANNPDVFIPFFLNEAQARRVQMASVDGFLVTKRQLDSSQLFIMPPDELERARASGKLVVHPPERIIPYPDGRPGFYFVRLEYVDHVESLFAADSLARQALVDGSVTLAGEQVRVRHSRLDMGRIRDALDGDTRTLFRGLEANPLVVEFSFGTAKEVTGVSLDVGSMEFAVKVEASPEDGGTPTTSSASFRNNPTDPHVDVALPHAVRAQTLRLEITNLHERDVAHIHVREITVR
jgi:hypothetical protein